MRRLTTLALVVWFAGLPARADEPKPPLVRSAKSGPWSAADTWEGGKPPGAGSRVQVRAGHTVTYDAKSDAAVRSVHVAGVLTFARDRDTLLTVGLIKVQPGDDASESGFDCDAHVNPPGLRDPIPTMEMGTPNDPILAKHTAVIRLALVDGLDRESCPAIICRGGRLDLHGAPIERTWLKLGATANAGSDRVRLERPAVGWRAGDRIALTATGGWERLNRNRMMLRPGRGKDPVAQTEEHLIAAVDGSQLTLDKPLAHRHDGDGDYRGEVANLSRNVVVESADPGGARGHTMYHRYSSGSISYAEFRHLGKEGVLGKYPIHFHLCGDTMRGSSVVGASVWDSHNRWVVIHGTQYLVIRDCVGCRGVGHGFFLEDGTEVFNVLDRNLAVLAYAGKPLPKQALPLDRNDGAGFWWANNLNTFTNNVAAECDRWGFLFEIEPAEAKVCRLPVLQQDGATALTDIRALPFVRFEGNESHDQLDGVALGGKVGGYNENTVPGDPLVVRGTRIWNANWAFTPFTRYVADDLDIADSRYGLFLPTFDAEHLDGGRKDDPNWGRFSVRRTLLPMHTAPAGLRSSFTSGPFNLMESLGDRWPPGTTITHARRAGDKLVVRGTAADDGIVRQVTVNGTEAKPVSANFSEWEATLDPPADGRLTARSVDRAGNEEPRPHVVFFDGARLRTVLERVESRATALTLPTRPGGDTKGMLGAWRVAAQHRAGRPAERPTPMVLKIDGNMMVPSAGGQPFRYRVGPAESGHIDLSLKVAVFYGIYNLDRDTLTLCMGPAQASAPYDPKATPNEKTRPARFDPEAGTVVVLKRDK
ncbi:MAG TPA: G8 domain-containing protein [Gemmataceae bacterium]|nr:G8 domain-containing protein [Gemmataceae bacterium]